VLPRIDPPLRTEPRKVEPARARANLASYVSDADYPSTAIRNEEQGTTRFRLGVGPDGKVTECAVTGSSGSSALDSATCRLMRQRAKFTPARDSDGRKTSDSVTSAIRWVLPE
jgi:protein TonB